MEEKVRRKWLELLEAAKDLMPFIWENNFAKDQRTEYESAVLSLRKAIAKAEGK